MAYSPSAILVRAVSPLLLAPKITSKVIAIPYTSFMATSVGPRPMLLASNAKHRTLCASDNSVRDCKGKMGSSSRNALLRVGSNHDQIGIGFVCNFQNALGRIAA